MERKIYVVVVAGGKGVRMGADTPKQFLPLDGRPVLQRTLTKFAEALPGIKLVVVLPEAHISTWKQMCIDTSFDLPQLLVSGGITRFHSVKAALAKVPDGALVMIHDGVRPLVSAGFLQRLAVEAQSCPALIPVMPIAESVKCLHKLQDGMLETAEGPDPDRSVLYGAQTPQVFWSEQIKAAYTQGYDTSFTDDASVARRAGIQLSYTAGEKYNIKLTTPEDMVLAGMLLPVLK